MNFIQRPISYDEQSKNEQLLHKKSVTHQRYFPGDLAYSYGHKAPYVYSEQGKGISFEI